MKKTFTPFDKTEEVMIHDASTIELYYQFSDYESWSSEVTEPIAQELSLRYNLPFNEYPGYMTLLSALEREMQEDFVNSDEIIFNGIKYTITYMGSNTETYALIRWYSNTYWRMFTIGTREECIGWLMNHYTFVK